MHGRKIQLFTGLRRGSCIVVLFCLLVGTHAFAQRPSTSSLLPTGGSLGQVSTYSGTGATADTTLRGDSTSTTGLQYHKETADSLLIQRVFMFHYIPESVKIESWWNPTLSPNGVHRADALESFDGDYRIGKGLLGHPHYSIYPKLANGLGLQLQPDPNEGYVKRRGNIWLYQTLTPYTKVTYNSSLNKDYVVGVTHTQNFRPGWNASFDYKLLRPTGTYTSSAAKNHYLDAVTNYFSSDARLQALAGVIWQDFRIDENGGIANDSYFTQQQVNEAGTPVNLYNMGSLYKEVTIFGHSTYNLARQVPAIRYRDSVAFRTVGDSLEADTITLTDTLLPSPQRTINAGVVGVDVAFDRRKRQFTDSTLWHSLATSLFWTNDAFPDHRWLNPLKLTVGIRPTLTRAVVEGDTMRSAMGIDPFARVELANGKSVLRAEGEMQSALSGDGGVAHDKRVAAEVILYFDSAKSKSIRLSATRQEKMPDIRYIHDALFAQGRSLAAIKTSQYSIDLRMGETLKLNLNLTNLDHNVWYDTLRLVHEGGNALWLYQASLLLKLQWDWFHLDLQQLIQHSTDSIQMPVPLWASKNSLYADLSIFGGAARMHAGFDVRFHTPFFSPVYDPYTGLFLHQNTTHVGGYLWADAFIDINVKRASFYIKAGHLNALWETSPTYFVMPHYPGANFGVYWGITWNFFD